MCCVMLSIQGSIPAALTIVRTGGSVLYPCYWGGQEYWDGAVLAPTGIDQRHRATDPWQGSGRRKRPEVEPR